MGNRQHTFSYWLELARFDLAGADALMQARKFVHAGFLCHQCIEKTLKACWSFSTGMLPPNTHNLAFLMEHGGFGRKTQEEHRDLLDELECLDTEARYPQDVRLLLESATPGWCRRVLDETRATFHHLEECLAGGDEAEECAAAPGSRQEPAAGPLLYGPALPLAEKLNRYAGRVRELHSVLVLAAFKPLEWFKEESSGDIDLAVVLGEEPGGRYLELYRDLFRIRRGIDLRIEPHLFFTGDLVFSGPGSFLEEILETGETIYRSTMFQKQQVNFHQR